MATHDITSWETASAPPLHAPEHLSGHAVQFYGTDDFLIETVSRRAGTALGSGDAAMIIATEPHLQKLEQQLRSRGINLALVADQGRYRRLNAADVLARFVTGYEFDARGFTDFMGELIRQTHAATGNGNGPGRMFLFGEMVAVLWARGNPAAALRLEQVWNELGRLYPFYLLCAYPMSGFGRETDAAGLRSICAEHTHVVPAENYTELASEAERQLYVVQLQQQATALQAEIKERARLQESLRRREAELADLFENAVVGLHWLGPDGTIVWANRAQMQLLGYTPEEYIGQPVSRFFADPGAAEEMLRQLGNNEMLHSYETRLRHKDGSVRHALINSSVYRENGRFIHTRCFIVDVTERKLAEDALRRTEKMAETGRLAAAIAHEINNPLEAVTNLLFIVKEDPRQEDAPRFLHMADRELRRVSEIAKRTLGFFRDTSEPQRIDLGQLIEDVVEVYRSKIQDREITVESDYRAATVMGCPGELRQVISNLLLNAVDASPAGGVIRLRVRRRGSTASVVVADRGCGISRSGKHRVFEPFFTTKRSTGTGLGLWVTRELVRKHAGHIAFRSATGVRKSGTVFRIKVPLAA